MVNKMPAWNAGKSAVLDWLRAHIGHKGSACLIWPFSTNWNGYGHLKFDGRIQYAHRIMCILAHGAPPTPTHVAAHSCHNGSGGCVHPAHVSWKTPRDNLLDRRAAGTLTKKRWHNKGVLSRDQIAQIYALKGKKNQREIAAMFGISYQHVSVIHQGRLVSQRTG